MNTISPVKICKTLHSQWVLVYPHHLKQLKHRRKNVIGTAKGMESFLILLLMQQGKGIAMQELL